MKKNIYLISKPPLLNIIKEIFFDFDIRSINFETLKDGDLKNKNILIIDIQKLNNNFYESFFLNNNVVVCFLKKPNNFDISKYHNTKFFFKKINVKKFFDEVKTFFISKSVVFKNNKISEEKIINLNTGLSFVLTPLEKEILTVLFEKKQIKKEYLLEEVLRIKKDIETKTIESHLTRIRKKLIKIESEIHITSKDDNICIEG